MVNPDSVARNHPDWILSPPRPTAAAGPHVVLDLTNPDAFDYIYGCMDQRNRRAGRLHQVGPQQARHRPVPPSGRPAVRRPRAVYNIFKGLKTAHPGLEIGKLLLWWRPRGSWHPEHADRIWVSDCVDPVERADIQRYTSLLVPPAMMGEHVGASPHTPPSAPPAGNCAWPWRSSVTWASNGTC